MAGMHTLEQGESLQTIAERNGLRSWRTIWDHPQNASLRASRARPDLVHPGDQVYVPARESREEPGQTDTTNQFTARIPRTEDRIRSITILIHGVNTNAAWYPRVINAMRRYQDVIEVPNGGGNVEYRLKYLIIPFTWGDYAIRKQGGHGQYAVDEVHQMFENPWVGYDRVYQGHSAIRMKELIDACNTLGVQVNVIAHSNGTLETCGALLLGSTIDNFILMGSPLDCDNARSQNELRAAVARVKSRTYSFWSNDDEWAWIKGGIGCFGDNSYYRERNPNIRNIEFRAGAVIRGVTITEEEVDHSDYMLQEHMPIFSAFIRELGDTDARRAPYDQEQVDRLMNMADWTNVSYYVQQRNITLNSPEMRAYQTRINALPR
jgi:hypothetical protein